MKITFLGAAEGVTGSCYYIETDHYKFLLDCGQFQGSYSEQKKNLEDFPFDANTLDFIVLTHAHIDHTGRLPKLVQQGYHQRVLMTRGTASLSEILLKDSARIHEYETERENEQRKKAGLDLVEPYFTLEDAVNTLQFFNPVAYDTDYKVNEEISVRFINAGHLLGSAHVYLTVAGETLLFSGDIGSQHSQILVPPKPAPSADYVIMENTYGDRNHKEIDARFDKLYEAIMETISHKGTVIIPAFSVGRTQDIIYGLNQLKKDKSFGQIPFYVDSPMAIDATRVFKKDTEGMKPHLAKTLADGGHPFEMKHLHYVDDPNAAYMLNFSKEPKVLISASGMCDAGRILHHLQAYLMKQTTSIIFVGYQSEESLGRQIQDKTPLVKILGEEVENRANAYVLSGFSGHADQNELLDWLSEMQPPKQIFLVHGEKNSIQTMAGLIYQQYGFKTYVPRLYETVEI